MTANDLLAASLRRILGEPQVPAKPVPAAALVLSRRAPARLAPVLVFDFYQKEKAHDFGTNPRG